MITPREMLRDYMTLLNILMQNPNATFAEVVGSTVTLKHADDDHDDPHADPWAPSRDERAAGRIIPSEEKKKFSPEDLDF